MSQTQRVTGTVKKVGLEGGVWAIETDSGERYELIDPPVGLMKDGFRAEVTGESPGADVSIGMLGGSLRVKSYRSI
jgi:hypothetical protein